MSLLSEYIFLLSIGLNFYDVFGIKASQKEQLYPKICVSELKTAYVLGSRNNIKQIDFSLSIILSFLDSQPSPPMCHQH